MTPRLDVVRLVVRDMAGVARFLPPTRAEDRSTSTVAGECGAAWDTYEVTRSFDPKWTEPDGTAPQMSLAFRVDSPAEVDAPYCAHR